VIGAVALLAGVLLGLAAARFPNPALLWAAGPLVALVLLTPLRRSAAPPLLALLLMGWVLASTAQMRWQSLRLVPEGADARVLIEGRVVSVPARDGADLRFDADVQVIEGTAAHDARPRRARLGWRNATVAPRVGERWRWVVRLAPPADTRNFEGVDTERFGLRDRVHLSARVLPAALNQRLQLANSSIDSARARIALRIADRVFDPDAAALLTALAVGLTDGMSADQWRVFNATGTTHLVAISGLHVTLFALLAFMCARLLWRWLPFATRVEREPFALLLGLAAAGAYALLAGFSVPTQRTWLMLGIFVVAKMQARHLGAGRTWSLALIAVLLLDPLAPLAAGFWLSFVAVGVILLVETTPLAMGRRPFATLRLQFAVMLTLAPLTFAVFDGVSIAGLWVNLVAIPLVSFVLVPLILAGALVTWVLPIVSAWLFGIAATLYDWLWPALVLAADGELALWRVSPPLWWFALAAFAGFIVLNRWPASLRLTGVCVALPLLCAPSRMPAPDSARVTVFDAGRGSSVLIATHSHIVLFDTGDSWNTHGTRVKQFALPALDALTRTRVDLLVLPSLNQDRALGAALLASERHVERILVGGGWPATSLPVQPCDDARFEWDGVRFETFAAGTGGRFCVLRISIRGHSILLAGDLDAAAETSLLARLSPGALTSDAILMSRQASSLASSPQWIEASGAGLAIATGGIAGSDSRDVALGRWRKSGAAILDTRRDGAIQLGLGTQGIVVERLARTSRYPFAWRRLQ
jgi:competence protein ComEC